MNNNELNELVIGTQETTPEDIAFNSDGTKMFIAGSSGDDINVYDLSTDLILQQHLLILIIM